MKELVSRYTDLKCREGATIKWARCPFCKDAAFTMEVTDDFYHCFHCGRSGNKLAFLKSITGASYKEASAMLKGARLKVTDSDKAKSSLIRINKDALRIFSETLEELKEDAPARKYVKKRRLSDETIKAFSIGYADGSLYPKLKDLGYDDYEIAESGLCLWDEEKKRYKDRFWNRLMFPIMDEDNQPIGFGGRVLGDSKPKYLNSCESKVFHKRQNLFGLEKASRSEKDGFILCEGYMDVISLHQAGFDNAVATLGTAITDEHAETIRKFTDSVYLCYDSDEAGQKATVNAVKTLSRHGITTSVISMPGYKDPDEFIQGSGRDAFKKQIASAMNGYLYLYSAAKSDDSPEKRIRQEELLDFALEAIV